MLPFGGFILGILAVQEEEERLRRRAAIQQLRIEREHLRNLSNPYDLDPEYFRRYYRILPHMAMDLVDVLRDHIVQNGATTIDPNLQVFAALRFFAEGGYQKGVGQDYRHPLSQTTVSRCVNDVIEALVSVADRYIRFPQTRQELRRVQERFLQHIRIPGIVGIIDGLLVSFIRPIENEEAFYNYKGYHAMNVQIICDADQIVRDIRICPGSNNDRYVWQYSNVKRFLEELRQNEEFTREEGRYYILGDSGYTPSSILLTPVRDPAEGTPDARYNAEFVRTRCRVEQLFGIMTAMFRGVKRERKLCFRDPHKIAKIITASAVLYNFRRQHGYLDDVQQAVEVINNDQLHEAGGGFDYRGGIAERDNIINRFYN